MSSSSQAPESWISAFCSLVGHEYFAEVSEDFIEDDFNLTGLQSQVPMYKEALEMILDVEPEEASDEDEEEEEEEDEDEDDDEMQDGVDVGSSFRRSAEQRRHFRMPSDQSMIESSAEMLYGLIHQRFITSRPGIQQMAEKYELNHFGHCPRVFCNSAKVLPVGCSDIPGQETVKLFCPSCLDVYSPPNSRFQTVDGAFFGTTFGCLFFMTFPDLEVGGLQLPKPPPPPSPLPSGSNFSSPLTGPVDRVPATAATTTAVAASAANSRTAAGNESRPAPATQVNGVNVRNIAPGLGEPSTYEPRIYGFRVNELSKSGPRMKWLRARPDDVEELDECAVWAAAQAMRAARGRGEGGGVVEEGEDEEEGEGDGEGEGVYDEDAPLSRDVDVPMDEGEEAVGRRRVGGAAVEDDGAMEVEGEGEAGIETRRKAKEKFGLGDSAGGALINGEAASGSRGSAVRVGDEG